MRVPYRFAAPWWAWVLTAAVAALLLRLGFWQVDRAEQKKSIISAYQNAAKSEPLDLNAALTAGKNPRELRAQALRLQGRFVSERQLLLDNQVSHAQVGYEVWTPLRLASGKLALVNRGWIAMNPNRRILPQLETSTDAVKLRGVWQPLPRPGLRIGKNACDAQAAWPRVVQYPLFEELQCLLGAELIEGVLWLDPADPNGFTREWAHSDFPPERHYGYALQWFALAATLVLLFVIVNTRRITLRKTRSSS